MPLGGEFDGGVDSESIEEGVVVAYDQQCASVPVKGFGKLFNVGDIQVVRRLIHDE